MSIPSTDTPIAGAHPWAVPPEGGERRIEPIRRLVLVVEDDPASRELLVELLVSWGYAPIPAGSAEEAEVACQRRQIEAAIVDVFLPGQSGVSLVALLRERFPGAVLIGISALAGAATAREMKGQGANVFLPKPIPATLLADALGSPPPTWH